MNKTFYPSVQDIVQTKVLLTAFSASPANIGHPKAGRTSAVIEERMPKLAFDRTLSYHFQFSSLPTNYSTHRPKHAGNDGKDSSFFSWLIQRRRRGVKLQARSRWSTSKGNPTTSRKTKKKSAKGTLERRKTQVVDVMTEEFVEDDDGYQIAWKSQTP